jgi:methyl-accepting chemotaxis protein
VPEVQAALLAKITTAEALAAADQAQRISAMLMLGVCLIALLIGLLIATRLARPIVALTRVAAGISAGDLGARRGRQPGQRLRGREGHARLSGREAGEQDAATSVTILVPGGMLWQIE